MSDKVVAPYGKLSFLSRKQCQISYLAVLGQGPSTRSHRRECYSISCRHHNACQVGRRLSKYRKMRLWEWGGKCQPWCLVCLAHPQIYLMKKKNVGKTNNFFFQDFTFILFNFPSINIYSFFIRLFSTWSMSNQWQIWCNNKIRLRSVMPWMGTYWCRVLVRSQHSASATCMMDQKRQYNKFTNYNYSKSKILTIINQYQNIIGL